ncbi:MAG: NAD(P)H-dependent oxidoreductase [Ignavibacteria bacterium]|nr:NAD(P)H-dependent oxidoreductase [Ignavibacteria bacterium]
MKKIKIVCIGGSLESGSTTFAALKYTADILKDTGADVYIADLKKLSLPLFSYKNLSKIKNKNFKILIKKVTEADGFLFGSPEYHGTISAAFKNTIDYLEILSKHNPPYLTLKPVGCIAVGGAENSGISTLKTMISIVHSLRALAAPASVAISYGKNIFDINGNTNDKTVQRRLKRLANEVYMLSEKLR